MLSKLVRADPERLEVASERKEERREELKIEPKSPCPLCSMLLP